MVGIIEHGDKQIYIYERFNIVSEHFGVSKHYRNNPGALPLKTR